MKHSWLNYCGVTLVLLLFWIAVSGSIEWPHLLTGFFTAIFVVYFNRNLIITSEDRPSVTLINIFWLIGYLLKLIKDILVANFQVAYLVLHPRMPIVPNMVSLRVDIDKVASRVLLGNSITLTPGTLTVLSDEKEFLVHALTIESGQALEEWELIKRLRRMEGKS